MAHASPELEDALTETQIQSFIHDEFVRVNHAFSRALAEEARTLLWVQLSCDPEDPSSW
jgi:hypothetical protein